MSLIPQGTSVFTRVARAVNSSKMQNTVEEPQNDLNFYGSFTCKEPDEAKALIKQQNNPKKIIVQEPSTSKQFRTKYFYFTLESSTGIKIQIVARNPQDEESMRKKRLQDKKKQ